MSEVPESLDLERVRSVLESMLLVSSEPLALDRVKEIILAESPATDPRLVDEAAAALTAAYAGGERGLRVDEVADGLQLRTPAHNAPYLRRLLAARPPKLTRPAMETLAVIAYRQPVTKPEIESIRGVDVGAVLKALLDRELIRIIGKSEDLGRPILYGTTKKFLELFGLKSLAALPTLREYNELDELHQKQVDELYEAERPKISDLAAKVAFLGERGSEAELSALSEAEASVERAGKVAAAVLAGDGLAVEARVTEPAPGAALEPSAPPAIAAAETEPGAPKPRRRAPREAVSPAEVAAAARPTEPAPATSLGAIDAPLANEAVTAEIPAVSAPKKVRRKAKEA